MIDNNKITIKKYPFLIDWVNLSMYKELSEDFIREFQDKVDWNYISVFQTLSEDFIREFQDKVYWINISSYQKLSENFIREFKDKIHWISISCDQILSESFIREFKNKINWKYISCDQILSENFIEEFQDKVNWRNISIYQKLSENFIRKFKDKVNWFCIVRYQKLSKKFIKEFNLIIPETCWIYKSKKFKEDYIKKYTDCKIKNGKVIAYKTTRIDGTSFSNFHYKYEIGKEYKNLNVDYNVNMQESFGFSAFLTQDDILGFNEGKLFKIEIDIKDIAAIVIKNNQIRATKIKILEEIDYDRYR